MVIETGHLDADRPIDQRLAATRTCTHRRRRQPNRRMWHPSRKRNETSSRRFRRRCRRGGDRGAARFRRPSPCPRHHEPLASGVIITADGLILSQYHVSHLLDENDFEKSRKPGERGHLSSRWPRVWQAELLGADRTQAISPLLRMWASGPYPYCARTARDHHRETRRWCVEAGPSRGLSKGPRSGRAAWPRAEPNG